MSGRTSAKSARRCSRSDGATTGHRTLSRRYCLERLGRHRSIHQGIHQPLSAMIGNPSLVAVDHPSDRQPIGIVMAV
jgi:hypothetical protein